MSALYQRENTLALLHEFTRTDSLRKHAYAVEASMRAAAERTGSDVEYWSAVGLLHDFDYEMYPEAPDHPLKGAEILRERGYPEEFVRTNVTGRDLVGFVDEARERIAESVSLPPGYYLEWGGQFENQQRAAARLAIVVPVSMGLIFLLLFSTFGSVRQALLVLTNIPFALIGGVIALWVTGEYLSVPASVGFIALLGIAVLNGVVMVSYFNQLRARGMPVGELVIEGARRRLSPGRSYPCPGMPARSQSLERLSDQPFNNLTTPTAASLSSSYTGRPTSPEKVEPSTTPVTSRPCARRSSPAPAAKRWTPWCDTSWAGGTLRLRSRSNSWRKVTGSVWLARGGRKGSLATGSAWLLRLTIAKTATS